VNIEQVALQLWSLKDQLKAKEDISVVLTRVREIGYRSVQVTAAVPAFAELEIGELADLIHSHGLSCCATHEAGTDILQRPEEVIRRLQVLGCRYTAYPYPREPIGTLEEVKSFAARLAASGRVLKQAGMVLTYHNHALEFRKLGERTILEHILEEDPESLQAEIDTYFVQNGGADPVAWCRRLRGRLPLLHIKDYGISAKGYPCSKEIGAGNLDFPALLREAEASGCIWYIVEQDEFDGDPFVSLKASYDYIKENLCS
jgi:sugar phosphate isomerase/epimerase